MKRKKEIEALFRLMQDIFTREGRSLGYNALYEQILKLQDERVQHWVRCSYLSLPTVKARIARRGGDVTGVEYGPYFPYKPYCTVFYTL